MNGIWRKSVLTRLFAFFTLVLMPTYVLSVIAYNWGTDGVIDKINTSSYSQMTEYMKRLEQEVGRMEAIQLEFVNDRDLIRMATIPDFIPWYDQYTSLLRLQQQTYLIKNSSSYAREVKIYLHRNGRVISTTSGVSPIKDDQSYKLRNSSLSLDSVIQYRDGELYLNLVMIPPNFSEDDTPLFNIEIQLDQSVLRNDLNQSGGEEVNVLLLTEDEASRVIANNSTSDPNMGGMLTEAVRFSGLEKDNIGQFNINQTDYSLLVVHSEQLNMTMYKFIRRGQYLDSLKKYTVWLWLFFGVSFLAIALFLISAYRVVYHPLRLLSSAFKRVENGNLNTQITHSFTNEFGFIYRSFNNMVNEIKVLIEQVYEQRILTERAQMKQLQSQINPHFLYNNFQIIHRMAKLEDNENLADLSIKLAQYYQYVTRNTKDDVPLGREIEFARMYTDIQLIRFQNRLNVEFEELPANIGVVKVPRLILQPILENAFEHGLKDKAADGRLWTRFEAGVDHVDIIIEDNGESVTEEALQQLQAQLLKANPDYEVTGLVNIHRRLQLKFGSGCGLQVERGEYGGLLIRVRISKEEKRNVQVADRG